MNPQQLIEQAETARRASYSPYSRFPVGAALLTRSGRIVHGCNVENASFGLSVCAERTALWKAVSEGDREFVAIAIAAGPGAVPSPCGACRQVLHEFAPDLSVYWCDGAGRIIGRKLEELLASPFVFDEAKHRGLRRSPGAAASKGAPKRVPKRASRSKQP